MAGEWETVQLGDVASTRNGAGIKQDVFSKTGIPLVRVSDFTDWSIDMSACIRVDFEAAKRWESHRLKEGETIVATVGSWPPNWSSVVGKAVRVPRSAVGAIQNQNTCCVLERPTISDQRFLFYLLRSESFAHYAANSAAGSANQARLPVANLERFEFPLPPLAEQKAIAAVLGALDDKIELNRRMNATLEAMARALFQSWFVDFDPVRAKLDGRPPAALDPATAALFPDSFQDSELGHIPKGWTIQPVGEVVDCVGGGTPSTAELKYWEGGTHHWTTPKDFSSLQAPFLLDTDRKLTDAGIAKISSGLLPAGTLLLSSRAPVGYLAISAMPVAINQGFIALKCNDCGSNFFMLNWCQTNMAEIESRATGTTFAEISKQNFRPIRVVLPPKELMAAFTFKVAPLYAQITDNLHQSRTLATLRDTLLPKLLSGELSVAGIEHTMENA